jgi:CRP-like cAMP-binding protein
MPTLRWSKSNSEDSDGADRFGLRGSMASMRGGGHNLSAKIKASLSWASLTSTSSSEDSRAASIRPRGWGQKLFGISRRDKENLVRLGIRADKDAGEKTFQNLKASMAFRGTSGMTRLNSSGNLAEADNNREIWCEEMRDSAVPWSIFDVFETDLGTDEPEPAVIRACSHFADFAAMVATTICFWTVWYALLLAAFWDVLDEDRRQGVGSAQFQVGIQVIDYILDAVFFFLTLARPRTTVLDTLTATETCRPKTLVTQELHSKAFWLDLASCLPWTHAVRSGLPEWVSLVKLVRARHLLDERSTSVILQNDIMFGVRLLFLVAIAGHCLACAYFAITVKVPTYDRHFYFISAQGRLGFFEHYAIALRTCVYLVLGADIEGYSDLENLFVVCWTPVGVMVNALVLSQVIVVIFRRSTLETQEVEERNKTRHAMQSLALPSALQLRIFAHYTFERVNRGHDTISKLLGGLSEQLNFELHLAGHYKLVMAVPFFRKSQPHVLRDIVQSLEDVIFLPGNFICRMGDESREMYFVHRGSCTVMGEDCTTVLRQVVKQDYFGEISLLTGMQRTAHVRADTFCLVAELGKEHFDMIMRKEPQALQVIVSCFSDEQKSLLLMIRRQMQTDMNEGVIAPSNRNTWRASRHAPFHAHSSAGINAAVMDGPRQSLHGVDTGSRRISSMSHQSHLSFMSAGRMLENGKGYSRKSLISNGSLPGALPNGPLIRQSVTSAGSGLDGPVPRISLFSEESLPRTSMKSPPWKTPGKLPTVEDHSLAPTTSLGSPVPLSPSASTLFSNVRGSVLNFFSGNIRGSRLSSMPSETGEEPRRSPSGTPQHAFDSEPLSKGPRSEETPSPSSSAEDEQFPESEKTNDSAKRGSRLDQQFVPESERTNDSSKQRGSLLGAMGVGARRPSIFGASGISGMMNRGHVHPNPDHTPEASEQPKPRMQRRPSILQKVSGGLSSHTERRRPSLPAQKADAESNLSASPSSSAVQGRGPLSLFGRARTMNFDNGVRPMDSDSDSDEKSSPSVPVSHVRSTESQAGRIEEEVDQELRGVVDGDFEYASGRCAQTASEVRSLNDTMQAAIERMRQSWLAARGEVRDDRRDMQLTLENLADQVCDAREELVRMVAQGEEEQDLALQAMNFAASQAEQEEEEQEVAEEEEDIADRWSRHRIRHGSKAPPEDA